MPLANSGPAPSSPGSAELPQKRASRLGGVLVSALTAYAGCVFLLDLVTLGVGGAPNQVVTQTAVWIALAAAVWVAVRAPSIQSGSPRERIIAKVVSAYPVFLLFGALLILPDPGAADKDLMQAGIWVALGVVVLWPLLRVVFLVQHTLEVVSDSPDDARVSTGAYSEWSLGKPSGLAGGVATVALVVAWWPWTWGRGVGAVVAFFLGYFGGLIVELFYLGPGLRSLAARLLARKLPQFREQLHSPDPTERAKAARAIGCRAMPDLIEALKDESAEVRAAAGRAIHGCSHSPNVPSNLAETLRPLLHDPDLRVRIAAAAILTELGVASGPEVIPVLTEGLTDPDRYLAETMAAMALAEFGPAAEPAIPALRAAVFDRDPPYHGALYALGKIGKPALPVLVDALTHADLWVRVNAADELGLMGNVAASAIAPLQAAQSDKEERVRRAATKALDRIRDQP